MKNDWAEVGRAAAGFREAMLQLLARLIVEYDVQYTVGGSGHRIGQVLTWWHEVDGLPHFALNLSSRNRDRLQVLVREYRELSSILAETNEPAEGEDGFPSTDDLPADWGAPE